MNHKNDFEMNHLEVEKLQSICLKFCFCQFSVSDRVRIFPFIFGIDIFYAQITTFLQREFVPAIRPNFDRISKINLTSSYHLSTKSKNCF